MKRKVNRVGTNTLTVSLPSKWAKKYNLQKGNELDFIEEGNTLNISIGDIIKEKRSVTVTITKEENYMRRIITGMYLKGFDEIKIQFSDKKVFDRVQKDSKLLLGFEIVEQKDNYCILRNVSKGLDSELNTLLDRLFNIVLSFNKELFITLKEGDLTNINRFISYEENSNRISLFCKRMINLNILSDNMFNNTSVYIILSLLERISDELDWIVDFIEREKIGSIKLDKSTEELFKLVSESLQATQEIFSNFLKGKEYSNVFTSFEKQRKIRYSISRYKLKFLSSDKTNSIISFHLTSAIEHIQHMSEALIG